MKERDLEEWEKDFIRDEIQKAVKNGSTVKQIRDLRMDLKNQIGCSLNQVGSVSAWKKNEGNSLELKPLELQTGSEIDVPSVTTEVTNSANVINQAEETLEILSDIPKIENTTTTSVQEINLQLLEDVNSFPEVPVQDITIETLPESEITVLPDNVRVHPSSGAWTDYEHSVVKGKWRAVEMKFIDKHAHLIPKKPEDWQVLCTPGIKCYLEVKHLLDRGVQPKNITAIEREKGAWGEFVTNCQALGIKPVFGDLKKVLPDLRTQFDLVLLDFLGQYCHSNQEVVYQVPVSDTAIVSINMGGKRERKDVQMVMQKSLDEDLSHRLANEKFSEKYRNEKLKEEGGSKPLNAQERSDRFFRFFREANQEAYTELQARDIQVTDEHRDVELLALLNCLGMGRPDSWSYPNMVAKMPSIIKPHHLEDVRKEEFNPNFIRAKNLHMALDLYEGIMYPFRLAIKGKALKANSQTRAQYEKLSDDLGPIVDLAWKSAIGSVKVHSMEKYRYLSRVGKTPSPYLTNIAVVQRPRLDYRKQQQTTNFALNVTNVLAENHGKEPKIQYPVGIQDERIWVRTMDTREQVKTITSIQIDTALADVERYWELENKYPLSRFDNVKNLPRVNIEE